MVEVETVIEHNGKAIEPAEEDLCGVWFPHIGEGIGISCTKPRGHDEVEHTCDVWTIHRFVPTPSSTSWSVSWELVDVKVDGNDDGGTHEPA